MTTSQQFLDAIAASPNDLAIRLQFADWLEERGNPLCHEWRKGVTVASVHLDDGVRYGRVLGTGSGHGNGVGNGYGHGSAFGYRYRYGYRDGDGSGNGIGYGQGYSAGDGYGLGDGNGYGDGDGSDDGDGFCHEYGDGFGG